MASFSLFSPQDALVSSVPPGGRRPRRLCALRGPASTPQQEQWLAAHDQHKPAHFRTCRTHVAAAPLQAPLPAPEQQGSSAPSVLPQELQEFLSWAVAHGVQGLDSRIKLVQTSPTERGLVCAQVAKRGDVLLQVPFPLLLTDPPSTPDDPGLALYKDAPRSVRLAARLLREKARGAASPWHHYIQSLPRRVPCLVTTSKEQPQLLVALEYPPMASTLQTLRVMMGDAYRSCSQQALAGAPYKEFEWALAVSNSRMLGAALGGAAAAGEPPRSSDAGLLQLTFLAPLVDMVNHAPPQRQGPGVRPGLGGDGGRVVAGPTDNVKWVLHQRAPAARAPPAAAPGSSKGFASRQPQQQLQGKGRKVAGTKAGAVCDTFSDFELQVVATQDIQPGEELLLCYRPDESNDTFLLHYGFLPGSPASANPDDDVALFMDGLQEALQWHCHEFAVKTPLPQLGLLGEQELVSLYQRAYDDGVSSLVLDQGGSAAATSPIKIKADAQTPDVLQQAFGSISQAAAAAAATGLAPSLPSSAAAAPLGSGSAAATDHARAAVARRCLHMLRERTPLLHDLCALADCPVSAPAPAPASAPAASSGGQELHKAVMWAQLTGIYQQKVQDLAQRLADEDSASAPETSAAISTWQQGRRHEGESPSSRALKLLQVAGCGAAVAGGGGEAVGVAGQGGLVASAQSPAALAASGTLRMALHYRVQKKMVLWDYVLACEPVVLRQALW